MNDILNKMVKDYDKRLWFAYDVAEPENDYALVFPKDLYDKSPFESPNILYGKSKNVKYKINREIFIVECYVVDITGKITHCHMTLTNRLNTILRNSDIVLEDKFAKVIGCRYIGKDRSKGFEYSKVNRAIPFDTECVNGKFFTDRQVFKDAVSDLYDIFDEPDDILRVDVKRNLNKVQGFIDKANKDDLYFLNCDINRIIEKYEDKYNESN